MVRLTKIHLLTDRKKFETHDFILPINHFHEFFLFFMFDSP